MLEYTIKRMKRKTLAAYVLDSGTIEVRAPKYVSEAEIEAFINSREAILTKYIETQKMSLEKRNEFLLDIGSKILYLGKECEIRRGAKTEIKDDIFYVTDGNIKNQVTALYKIAASKLINERVKLYSQLTGHTPSSVKINSAKTRWGSCSAKRAVNFSWFLIMADMQCIDYVVIHELSHMSHMNHSDKFWNEVAKYEPQYKQCRQRLKLLATRLKDENW